MLRLKVFTYPTAGRSRFQPRVPNLSFPLVVLGPLWDRVKRSERHIFAAAPALQRISRGNWNSNQRGETRVARLVPTPGAHACQAPRGVVAVAFTAAEEDGDVAEAAPREVVAEPVVAERADKPAPGDADTALPGVLSPRAESGALAEAPVPRGVAAAGTGGRAPKRASSPNRRALAL